MLHGILFLSDSLKKKNPLYHWNETCPLSWQKAHKNVTVLIIIIMGGCFILFNGMSFLCFCMAYICIWSMAIESNGQNIVVNLCDSSRWILSTFFSINIAFEASAHRAYYITLCRSKFRMKLINRFGGLYVCIMYIYMCLFEWVVCHLFFRLRCKSFEIDKPSQIVYLYTFSFARPNETQKLHNIQWIMWKNVRLCVVYFRVVLGTATKREMIIRWWQTIDFA